MVVIQRAHNPKHYCWNILNHSVRSMYANEIPLGFNYPSKMLVTDCPGRILVLCWRLDIPKT